MAENVQTCDEYTLFCNGKLDDPFPFYHRLRSEDPVHWSDLADSWILTRYDDVVSVQKNDPRLTAERITPLMNQLPEALQAETQPLRRHLSAWMKIDRHVGFGYGIHYRLLSRPKSSEAEAEHS
jgi:cytochrome P450